jgi:mannose-1-phosphate guanylyltransferase
MSPACRTWAVVLAAGEGTRLASLTRDAAGNSVPKQFCSLNGGNALVHEALGRARHIAPREQVCAIVAQQHARYWRKTLQHSLEARNIIVQPQNRGTANGVLLCALTILERDPLARMVFLPADHFVLDESALARALCDLSLRLTHNPDGLTLIGIEPDEADSELGYIVPGRTLCDGSRTVARFVEKPPLCVARELLNGKALWNSFIFAATGSGLLVLLRRHLGVSVDDMATALARDSQRGASSALTALYERLPVADFSRAIVQHAPHDLRVITAPACGWNDLGTPRRVAETLRRLDTQRVEPIRQQPVDASPRPLQAFVNLAAQHARQRSPVFSPAA